MPNTIPTRSLPTSANVAAMRSILQTVGDDLDSWSHDDLESWGSNMRSYAAKSGDAREIPMNLEAFDRMFPPEEPRYRGLGSRIQPGSVLHDDLTGRSAEPAVYFKTAEGRTIRGLRHNEPVAQHDFDAPEHDFPIGAVVAGILTGNTELMAAGQIGSSDSAGGYLLSTPVSTLTVDLARAASVCMRAGATTIPMETSELAIARLTQDPTAQWRAEGVTVTSSALTFDRVTLRAKTLAAIVPISIELAQYAPNAPQLIEQALTNALGLAFDQAALVGTGAGAVPLGLTNTSGINTVSSVGEPQDATDISSAVGDILEANYNGEVSALAWIRHPREAMSYDKIMSLADPVFNQNLMGGWTGQIQKFQTTSLPIDGGAGSDEGTMVVGHFPQMVFGTRTTGVTIRILDSGTVTDADSVEVNAASDLQRLVC